MFRFALALCVVGTLCLPALGENNVSGDVRVGGNAVPAGTVGESGHWTTPEVLEIYNSGVVDIGGALTAEEGAAIYAGGLLHIRTGAVWTATYPYVYTLSGGTLQIDDSYYSYTPETLNWTGGTLNALNAALDTAGSSVTFPTIQAGMTLNARKMKLSDVDINGGSVTLSAIYIDEGVYDLDTGISGLTVNNYYDLAGGTLRKSGDVDISAMSSLRWVGGGTFQIGGRVSGLPDPLQNDRHIEAQSILLADLPDIYSGSLSVEELYVGESEEWQHQQTIDGFEYGKVVLSGGTYRVNNDYTFSSDDLDWQSGVLKVDGQAGNLPTLATGMVADVRGLDPNQTQTVATGGVLTVAERLEVSGGQRTHDQSAGGTLATPNGVRVNQNGTFTVHGGQWVGSHGPYVGEAFADIDTGVCNVDGAEWIGGARVKGAFDPEANVYRHGELNLGNAAAWASPTAVNVADDGDENDASRINLQGGSTWTSKGNVYLKNRGSVNLDSGSAWTSESYVELQNNSTVNIGAGSTWSSQDNVHLFQDAAVTIGEGGTWDMQNTPAFYENAQIILDGGTMKLDGSFNTNDFGSHLAWTAGTIDCGQAENLAEILANQTLKLPETSKWYGTGTLNGGTLVTDGNADAGQFTWAGGTLDAGENVSGLDRLDAGKTMKIVNTSNWYGPRIIDGGTLIVSGELNLSDLNLQSGIVIGNDDISGSMSINPSGTLQLGSIMGDSFNVTLDGGTLIVDGSGEMDWWNKRMNWVNGTLRTNQTIRVGSGGDLVLYDGQRLEATHIIVMTRFTNSQGTFAPGNSPADSLIDGEFWNYGDATLEMEIGGRLVGDEYDRLTVNGEAHLDGTLSLLLIDGFAPEYGDVFDLFNWLPGTGGPGGMDYMVYGEFETLLLPNLDGGLWWDTDGLYTTGEIAVVPEPATMTLLLAGALYVGRRRRRK